MLETDKRKTNVKSSKLFKYTSSSLKVTQFCDSINYFKTSINFSLFVCSALMVLELEFQQTSLLVGIYLLPKTLSATAVYFEEQWKKQV